MTMTLKETVSSEISFMKVLVLPTVMIGCGAILFLINPPLGRDFVWMNTIGNILRILGIICMLCLLFSTLVYLFWKNRLTDENETVETENYQRNRKVSV
jgi:hypothetical protein